MPWKTNDEREQRWELLQEIRRGKNSLSELCRRFNISRKTAYKWSARYRRKGLFGLGDRPHKAKRINGRPVKIWLERIKRARRKRPNWGARKLQWSLEKQFGKKGLPSVAAISRWLKKWGAVKVRRRPRKAGPLLSRRSIRPSRRCNDLWTVDYKGWFHSGNGERCEPLTVRDLHSRYILCIRLLRQQNIDDTKKQFIRIFNKYGIPKRIRCDNGSPFGGGGPTGLTRLSAWWVRLGIEVEFITPGRPCENGAHEQFHRVFKAEQLKKLSKSRQSQQRRSNHWRRHYNEQRPHEALKMRVPASIYRRSNRSLPKKILPFRYGVKFERRWVKGNGEISWHGRKWFVGEAFVRDHVGLRRLRKGVWQVYFCRLLIGELHEGDSNSIRPALYKRH